MPLQQVLSITIATLAAMGTALLGMGRQEVGMILLMAMGAGLSVWLTDAKGWLVLSRRMASLAMLGAAIFSLRDIFQIRNEIQALNFAQLLVYLQIILLFQKKDERIYWLLIMLSILQVVVAALFSQGIFFGILLVLYMAVASFALSLLMFLRSQSDKPAHPSHFLRDFWSRLSFKKLEINLKSGGRNGRETNPSSVHSGSTVSSRWPLGHQHSELIGEVAGSSIRVIGREFFHRLTTMSFQTLALTMLLFLVVPRFGKVEWRSGMMMPKSTVGFTDRVSLGEMGKILESPTEVMRIHFFEKDTDKTYSVNGEIYLHGTVLMKYNAGQWSPGTTCFSLGENELAPPARLPDWYVRQECVLEGLDRPELFYVAPYFGLKRPEANGNFSSNRELSVENAQLRLKRPEHLCRRPFSYQLGTTAFQNHRQLRLKPMVEGEWNYLDHALVLPTKDGEPALKKLAALADAWIAESKLPKEDRVGRARYLEQKLRDPSVFKYSLEGQDRDPTMDPIEDFLTVHRAGHCEYFATALVLMLRSQGIPARLVVGYKCDEWNELGQCFLVRQLHAHTWVEAYLRSRHLPKDQLHGEKFWTWEGAGGWLRLDPTPGGGGETTKGIFSSIQKGFQWLDFAWSYYVVELNAERQRKAIFTPLINAVKKTFEVLRDPATWQSFFSKIGEALHRSGAAGLFAWTLLVLAGGATLALGGLLGRWLWRILHKIGGRWRRKKIQRRRGLGIEVEFYRRFEYAFAQAGLWRPAGQTPREFAEIAGEWLVSRTGVNELLPLPSRVVEAYYRVRYGRLPLDSNQREEVEQFLTEIQRHLVKPQY